MPLSVSCIYYNLYGFNSGRVWLLADESDVKAHTHTHTEKRAEFRCPLGHTVTWITLKHWDTNRTGVCCRLCRGLQDIGVSLVHTQRIYSDTVYSSADREYTVISCSVFKQRKRWPCQELLTSSSQPGKPRHNRHNSGRNIITLEPSTSLNQAQKTVPAVPHSLTWNSFYRHCHGYIKSSKSIRAQICAKKKKKRSLRRRKKPTIV